MGILDRIDRAADGKDQREQTGKKVVVPIVAIVSSCTVEFPWPERCSLYAVIIWQILI